MDVIAGKIELYHRLFLGCLTLSILCLILAAVLFFVLDMKTVLGYLTGRQKRKKVKEMEAANAMSGRLLSRKFAPVQHAAQEEIYSWEKTAVLGSGLVRRGHFQIERELILIHSEEVI